MVYDGEAVKDDSILAFKGEYFFLSNFYPIKMVYDGIEYQSSEAAFQAQKTLDIEQRKKFSNLTPEQSKRLGRSLKLRDDWEKVKDNVMYDILTYKFEDDILKDKLLATGNRVLFEGNTWEDRYWGVVNDDGILHGKNVLGKALMDLRSTIRFNIINNQ